MFKFKKYKKEILLLIITLLIIFLTSEFFARVSYFGFKNAFSFEIYKRITLAGFVQASDNCEIIYELKPNIKGGNVAFSKFETNSHGLRDKEYSIEKPPGVRRVVVLGDSVTQPEGVDIDNAYHSILEERLNKEGNKVEFINFAVEGYHLGQYLAVLKNKAIKYNPDLVLIGFFVPNDMYWWTDNLSRCDYNPPERKNGFFTSFSLKLIKANSVNVYDKLTKNDEKASNECKWELPGVETNTFHEILQGFLDFNEETGIPVMWVLLPGLYYGNPSHPYHREVIMTLCEATPHFYVVDTLPLLYKRYVEEYYPNYNGEVDKNSFFREFWIYPSDHHPNEKAQEIFADIIQEKLYEYIDFRYNLELYQACINQKNAYTFYPETGKLRIGNYLETFNSCE